MNSAVESTDVHFEQQQQNDMSSCSLYQSQEDRYPRGSAVPTFRRDVQVQSVLAACQALCCSCPPSYVRLSEQSAVVSLRSGNDISPNNLRLILKAGWLLHIHLQKQVRQHNHQHESKEIGQHGATLQRCFQLSLAAIN